MFACLLVYHGSRDRRPGAAVRQLARRVAAQLPECSMVGTAALELHPLPLHQQIAEFGDRAADSGCDRLKILPLFLLPGVHAIEDIPAQVAIAQKHCNIPVELLSYLGSHPDLVVFLGEKMSLYSQVRAWILLSHGSRRPGSNEAIVQLVQGVEAYVDRPVVAAFWFTDGDLEAKVGEWVDGGQDCIGILPYFLFAGGITDAIAEWVCTLRLQLPSVQLTLVEPLGVDDGLVQLVVDVVAKGR